MSFFLDGSLVGTLNAGIFADFAIVDVVDLPSNGSVPSNLGGFFDLIGPDLRLDFNAFVVTSGPGGISVTGTASNLLGQALPFGLGVKLPFTGSGSGEVSAAAVPEPASMLLLGTGVACLRRSSSEK